MTDLWALGASELAGMIRAREVTSVEVVEAHLARIESVNPSVNAIVEVVAKEALTDAAAVDLAVGRGDELGPLAGVPITVKDNLDMAGHVTTHGSAALAENRVTSDSPVVERIRAAGAIPIARTNLPDLGLRIHTDSGIHGLTLNPWDPARTTSGSSGGEAVALVTGMSPLGLGNDLGGSLRNPATCCSIAAIKPTTGRVPHAVEGELADEGPVSQAFAADGPMARTVADVRLGLQVLSGWHVRDPISVPVPLEEPPPRPRRVAALPEPPGGSVDPRVAEVTRAAAGALTEAGHHVEELVPPGWDEALAVWEVLVTQELRQGFELIEPLLSADAATLLRLIMPETHDPDEVAGAWLQRIGAMRIWAEFFTEWDAVLTPTWTELPFPVGYDVSSAEGARNVLEMARPVMPGNALGLPSAAVPAGLVDGLPVGVLVTGAAWNELLCLEVAETIEASGLAPSTPIDPPQSRVTEPDISG